MGFYETLLSKKLNKAENLNTPLYDMLLSKRLAEGGGGVETTVTGYPLTLTASVGKPIVDYKIYGNSKQDILPAGRFGLEYIESSGAQYIDTGLTINATDKFKVYLDYQYLDSTDGRLGAESACDVNFRATNGDIRLNQAKNIYTVNDRNKFYIMSNYAEHRQAEYENTVYTGSDTVTSTTSKFILFARGMANGTVANNHSARLYRCIIWVNDVIVRDFYPCKRANNAVALYDAITNADFLNKGSGSFIASESVYPSPTDSRAITYIGTLVESGEHQGKYEIPIIVTDGTSTNTTSIYLTDPLRKIGDNVDYIDFANSKVVRVIGKMNMGEYQYSHSYEQSLYHLFVSRNAVEDMEFLSDGNVIPPWASEIYVPTTKGSSWKNYSTRMGNSRASVTVCNNDYDNATDFQTAMSGVYLYYKLATPTEETIELPEIATYKGDNTVTVDTELSPSNMEVTYMAKE